jgi:mycothiol synthase
MADPLAISPVPPQRWAEALALVFRDLVAEERAQRVEAVLAAGRSGGVPMDGLLQAQRGDVLAGALFLEIQPGRTALVWPPRLVPQEPAATARQLLAAASEWLAAEGICVAYAMLEPDARRDDGPLLEQAGFEPASELVYLASMKEHFPRTCPPGPLEYEPYCPENHDRLARLVEATYEGTLDCPRLNGIRRIDDVLAGYRATGVFDPSRWLLVRHRGEDVGCLLLADHPQAQNWELVYMGLVPSARGNGWGVQVARRAQWLAGRAGRERLVLAVDAANAPAIRVYSLAGFHAWDRRHVFLKVLRAGGGRGGGGGGGRARGGGARVRG